jgi:hypothetical protein
LILPKKFAIGIPEMQQYPTTKTMIDITGMYSKRILEFLIYFRILKKVSLFLKII